MITREDEQVLNGILEDGNTNLRLGKKVKKIKWVRNGTLRKITSIMLKDGDKEYEDTITAKLAAAYLLNGYWKIKFFWWIKWRLMWDRYSNAELKELIEECKKKVQLKEYYEIMISQIGLKDTLQTMTRKEVEAVLHAQQ